MKQIPIIIDTDPGLDDFFALMMAKSSQNISVRAITAVAGNQVLETTMKNALDIAEFFGLDCPVAKGAANPLNIPLHTAGHIHGKNGLGDVDLPTSSRKVSPKYAWDIMYEEAAALNGELEIVALGPLTNVAIAIMKYPKFCSMVKRIVLMGGSTETGNSTPYAEFNIYVDPLAADIVFKSGIPLVMVGLNVTTKTLLTPEELSCITSSSAPQADVCRRMLDFLLDTYSKIVKLRGVVLHDAVAVAYVINNNLLECKDLHVDIETRSGLNFGRTVVDLEQVKKDSPANCSVGIAVDSGLFRKMLGDMMSYYVKRKNDI